MQTVRPRPGLALITTVLVLASSGACKKSGSHGPPEDAGARADAAAPADAGPNHDAARSDAGASLDDAGPNDAAMSTSTEIISPDRRIDWSRAGIPDGIPNRTTVCAMLSPGATASMINAAIQACPEGQVVSLAAGTYDLSSGIDFDDKSNVTLRGAGPDQTHLVFTDDVPCEGQGAHVCFRNGFNNHVESPGNLANWTGGYAKGTTEITLDDTTNLRVGMTMVLDQLNDSNTDNGGIWVCEADNVCSDEGGQAGRTGRAQTQVVRVTAVGAHGATITPGLYMPNWRASQTPQAWWSNDLPITGSGIEDLSIDSSGVPDFSSGGPRTSIKLTNAYGCWVKNVASRFANRSHVLIIYGAHNVVRDSYFYNSKTHVSQSYGWELSVVSDNLIENNIMHHVTGPFQNNGNSGDVWGYNFTFDDYYLTSSGGMTWMQQSSYHHAAGVDMVLHEGNEGTGFAADGVHGTQNLLTGFRNRYHGWEPGKMDQTNAVIVMAFHRYMNLVGNVVGEDSYHTSYEWSIAPGSASSSIFSLGGSPGSGVPDDPTVRTTMLRWGNFDTVHDAAQFDPSEVPTATPMFPNAVPADHTLPASLYLTGRPGWWPSTISWPAIGPDVTGGTDVAGHVYAIPARRCYEMTAKDSSGELTAFNAHTCY